MGIHKVAMQFVRIVDEVRTTDDLAEAMATVTAALGFQYFALTHHVDVVAASGKAIRLHNYPVRWADYYDGNVLGVSDPVHRASHVTGAGFAWSKLASMIPLTSDDRRILDLGKAQGIGDGYTVPAHVPGEARGSCSFACDAARPMAETLLPLAQYAGTFAFEGARRLWSARGYVALPPAPVLTDRQRDCLLWAARGKSDWEISRILGVSHETVIRHLKDARERYGVQKRTLLAVRALFDGTLSFSDVLKH